MTKGVKRSEPFNAAVLDRIIANAAPGVQEPTEFSVPELMQRGMSRASANYHVARMIRAGVYRKRWGRARETGRLCWLYREAQS